MEYNIKIPDRQYKRIKDECIEREQLDSELNNDDEI